MPNILMLDSDRAVLTPLAAALEADGHRVVAFGDAKMAMRSLTDGGPDLAVVEFLPVKFDCADIMRRLRERTPIPVVMISSLKDETSEVIAFRAGADDYVRKPVGARVLVERVRALLRRRIVGAPAKAPGHGAIDRGGLRLDAVRHSCHWRGLPIALTGTEFEILRALAQHFGVVKSRSDLLDAVTDEGSYVDPRTVDGHVKRIRRKFRAADPQFDLIETLYGVGYRLREGDDPGRGSSPEITASEAARR